MKKKNRAILLKVAKRLDRYAMSIRSYVKRQTPKRNRKAA